MNREASRSEDAALRRLLRELDQVAPPDDFDARLRARLADAGACRSWASVSILPISASRFAAPLVIGVLLVAIHTLSNFGVLSTSSPETDINTRTAGTSHASAMSAGLTENSGAFPENFGVAADSDFVHLASAACEARITNTAMPLRRSAGDQLGTNRRGVRSVLAPHVSANGRATRRRIVPRFPSPGLRDDERIADEVAATIAVHAVSVPVAHRRAARDFGVLLLNPVSFGDAPLAHTARSSMQSSGDALLAARSHAPQTQNAW